MPEPLAARAAGMAARVAEKNGKKEASGASKGRRERDEPVERKGASISSTSELRQGKLTFKSSTARAIAGDSSGGAAGTQGELAMRDR